MSQHDKTSSSDGKTCDVPDIKHEVERPHRPHGGTMDTDDGADVDSADVDGAAPRAGTVASRPADPNLRCAPIIVEARFARFLGPSQGFMS